MYVTILAPGSSIHALDLRLSDSSAKETCAALLQNLYPSPPCSVPGVWPMRSLAGDCMQKVGPECIIPTPTPQHLVCWFLGNQMLLKMESPRSSQDIPLHLTPSFEDTAVTTGLLLLSTHYCTITCSQFTLLCKLSLWFILIRICTFPSGIQTEMSSLFHWKPSITKVSSCSKLVVVTHLFFEEFPQILFASQGT